MDYSLEGLTFVSIRKGSCPRCGSTNFRTPKETGWFFICECGYWEADVEKGNKVHSVWGYKVEGGNDESR